MNNVIVSRREKILTQLDIPAEVAAIEYWLKSNGYEIGLHCLEADPYEICAVGDTYEINHALR